MQKIQNEWFIIPAIDSVRYSIIVPRSLLWFVANEEQNCHRRSLKMIKFPSISIGHHYFSLSKVLGPESFCGSPLCSATEVKDWERRSLITSCRWHELIPNSWRNAAKFWDHGMFFPLATLKVARFRFRSRHTSSALAETWQTWNSWWWRATHYGYMGMAWPVTITVTYRELLGLVSGFRSFSFVMILIYIFESKRCGQS